MSTAVDRAKDVLGGLRGRRQELQRQRDEKARELASRRANLGQALVDGVDTAELASSLVAGDTEVEALAQLDNELARHEAEAAEALAQATAIQHRERAAEIDKEVAAVVERVRPYLPELEAIAKELYDLDRELRPLNDWLKRDAQRRGEYIAHGPLYGQQMKIQRYWAHINTAVVRMRRGLGLHDDGQNSS